MNFKQALSWKILLPLGIILWIIFYGGMLGILGPFITLMGIIDLVRQWWNKRKKTGKNQPVNQ